MDKIDITANIVGDSIDYTSMSKRSELREFIKSNSGKSINIKIEVIDSPAYFQHKYYRGQLVPDIAHNESEVDVYTTHEELKKKLIRFKVETWGDIPSKYRSKCSRFEDKNNEKWYTPSTADLTYKEMREYILNVEKYLDKIGGHLGDCGHTLRSIEEIRNSALGIK